MRTKTIIITLLLAITSLINPSSHAGSANSVVVSPCYSLQQAALVRDQFVFYLLTSAPAESSWWLINGDVPGTICGPFAIPTLKVDNLEARKRALARNLAEITAWFGRQNPSGTQTNTGLICLPQALDFIASRKAPGPLTVYAVANPLYLPVNDDTDCSFVGGRYPSFGHLFTNRLGSDFSLQGRTNQLQNVVVHFNFLSDSVFAGNRHRIAIETWWQAFIEGQGGRLGLFDASLRDFFGTKAAVTREKVPVTHQDLKVAMLVVPPPVVSEPIVAATPTNSVPADVAAALKRWNDEFDRLERDKNFPRLAGRLQQALKEVPARYQPTNWCPRLVDVLVAWADTLTDRAARRSKLQAALTLAGTCPCAPTVPALKLSLLDSEEKAEKDRALTEFTSLLQAGDAIPGGPDVSSLQNKFTLYQKAADVANMHGLPIDEVENRIQSVQRELDRLLVPAALPVGCLAEITRLWLGERPYAFMDVFVRNASGEPVRGLQRKDFGITCDGRPPKAAQIASVQNQPPPVHLVMVLDESGSMAGKPLNATKAAAKAMLADSAHDDRLSVKVIAFSDTVRVLCDFSADKLRAATAIDNLKARGETALFDAITTAAEALKQSEGGRRVLLVFTDGRDNASRIAHGPSELARQLRVAGIETYAIGLRLAEPEKRVLRQLADQYLDAGSPEQLRSVFADAREQMAREVYRFVITPDQPTDTSPRSFRVKVGGTNAVVADYKVQTP